MSKLTIDQVKHIAKLANLPLTKKEEEKYLEQLAKILGYIEDLNSVDTSNVDPTFNVSMQSNIYHPDQTVPSLGQEEVLSNNKDNKNGMYVVKRVVGGE